jgi:hypothetical protein
MHRGADTYAGAAVPGNPAGAALQAVIDAHRELDEAYRGLAHSHVSEMADVVRGARLQQGMTAEQCRRELRVITGVPGAGKTFLIDRIAAAYRADGWNVRAVSVANSAVDLLRRDSSVPTRSGCSEMFTWEIEEKKRLSKRDLLLSTKSACLPTNRNGIHPAPNTVGRGASSSKSSFTLTPLNAARKSSPSVARAAVIVVVR